MSRNRKVIKDQPKKDSNSKRVNFDNERVSKFDRRNRNRNEDKMPGIRCDSTDNDVSWYTRNKELFAASSSIWFSNVTGQKIGFDGADSVVPGIMAVDFLPCIGGYDNNAINQAKASIYSYVVHANSRNTEYDDTDLMMMILAASDIFAMISKARMAYGIMKQYSGVTTYIPQGLIQALGFDYQDLKSNLSDMWFDINQWIDESTQIWIPNTMPFLDRKVWMNSNVYMDSMSPKGQYYVLNQESFLIYSPATSQQGGELRWVTPAGTPIDLTTAEAMSMNASSTYKWSTFSLVLNSMIKALLSSTDRGVILGDILKAYGSDKIFALSPMPVEYRVIPVYNQEVLTQIENSCSYGRYYFSISQNTATDNSIYTNWGIAREAVTVTQQPLSNTLLNFHNLQAPTNEQILVATRLTISGAKILTQSSGSNQGKFAQMVPYYMGTEYVRNYRILTSVVDTYGQYSQSLLNTKFSSADSIDNGTFRRWSAFDWAPPIYYITGSQISPSADISTITAPKVTSAASDYCNYTVLSADELRKLHTTAVYSEFDVPTLG